MTIVDKIIEASDRKISVADVLCDVTSLMIRTTICIGGHGDGDNGDNDIDNQNESSTSIESAKPRTKIRVVSKRRARVTNQKARLKMQTNV